MNESFSIAGAVLGIFALGCAVGFISATALWKPMRDNWRMQAEGILADFKRYVREHRARDDGEKRKD